MPSGYDESVHEDEQESRRVFLSVVVVRLGTVLGKRAGAAAMLSIKYVLCRGISSRALSWSMGAS